MLIVKHKAKDLYREDAWRDYCLAVDAYGAYQPASFIYLCFQGFKEYCTKYGIRLVWGYPPSERQDYWGPFRHDQDREFADRPASGLIIRITDDESVSEILKSLDDGCNVIAMLPCESIRTWHRADEKQFSLAEEAVGKLGIAQAYEKVREIEPFKQVWWEEIDQAATGRLFVCSDTTLSDAHFLKGYDSSENNLVEIERLVQAFSTFKLPCFRLEARNSMTSWPCHEPLNLIVDISNHGPDLKDVEIEIEFSQSFEPLNSLEKKISTWPTGRTITFTFQIVPRQADASTAIIKSAVCRVRDDSFPIPFEPLKVEIVPETVHSLISRDKEDDAFLSHLLSICPKNDPFLDIQVLPELLKVDVDSCLNKIRSISEKLCQNIHTKHGLTASDTRLATLIRVLQDQGIMSARSIAYLNTIRMIGNLGSHPSGEPLVERDVRIASYALACVTEEILTKKLL